MKSIKEKAEDVYHKMSRISEPHGVIPACNKSYYLGDANEEKREGFEAGANYVLEQIERVIQGNLNSHSAFKLKCIKQIVEELKSNQ